MKAETQGSTHKQTLTDQKDRTACGPLDTTSHVTLLLWKSAS